MAVNPLPVGPQRIRQIPISQERVEDLQGRYVPSAAQASSQANTSSQSSPKPTKGFSDTVRNLFDSAVSFFGVLFGTSAIDNTPYVNLYNDLKVQTQNISGDEDLKKARALYLYEKSNEVMKLARSNIAQGKNPWEGLNENTGVQMSGMLASLSGNTLEQLYYHNCAVNWWSNYVLKSIETGSGKAISIDDLDNTWVNKNWDPSDTWLVQSMEGMSWGRQISSLGGKLGVSEWINTARGPFPTLIQLVPEGLDRYVTTGILHGPLQERFGLSIEDQLSGAKTATVIALNSSVIHKPYEPTFFSSKLLREAELFEFLEGPEGKKEGQERTFLQEYIHLVNKEGFSVFEAKSVPKYLLDTHKILGETYLPNYLQIVDFKKRHVDNRATGVSEEQAWKNFSKALKEGETVDGKRICGIDDGKELWREVDRLKAVNASSEELLQAREKAYECVRLIGCDTSVDEIKERIRNDGNLSEEEKGKLNQQVVDDYELLSQKPQEFFNKITQGVLIAPTVHFYDNHGTPVKDAVGKISNIFEQLASRPDVRQKVAQLNMKSFNGNGLHMDITNFKNEGIEKFVTEGTKGYLEWRMCKYIAQRFSREQLKNMKMESGGNLFDCSDSRNLKFSEEFINKSTTEFSKGIDGYRNFLKEEFRSLKSSIRTLPDIVESFLPDENKCPLYDLDAISKELKQKFGGKIEDRSQKEGVLIQVENELKIWLENNYSCFYPNEIFSINNNIAYDNSYFYGSILNLVIKKSKLDPEGQYYIEVQPAREKHLGVPDFDVVLGDNSFLHVAGDSKSDVCMMAASLERGGSASIVFNLDQDVDIYKEIIKQRRGYLSNDLKEFVHYKDIFNKSVKAFGICGLESVDAESKGFYKVIGFDDATGDKIYKLDSNGQKEKFNQNQLLEEIRLQYQDKIIRNICPEAYVRRRAEIFGLLAGENIEFDWTKFAEAKRLNQLQCSGQQLSNEQTVLVKKYEWAIIAEKEGLLLPQEAPKFETFREWRGKDAKGNFAVYRSKSANGQFVIDRLDGSKPKVFTCTEEDLKNLKKVEVYLSNHGEYVYLNSKNEEIRYANLEKLKDYQTEHKLFLQPTKVKSLFGKSFIKNLPVLFNGLLKYSGGIMALGGGIRLLSSAGGEKLYNVGYWLSNGVRAVSACGGALRGVLNVHKAYNITFGEIINIVSSFLPNGVKHMGLGFGNFVLFLGRGQQRALMQQKVNSHTKKELEGTAKQDEFVDPRPFVRSATKLSTKLISDVKEDMKESKLSPLLGEIAGNLVSAVSAPILMIKDICKDPRLVFSVDKRMSEKSGQYSSNVPSPGHLMTLVGALSGISAITAGLFGRVEKFGEVAEGGFNKVGSWAIALANIIPAVGIIANAKEVMNNPDGLPRIFRGIDGKDRMYNPLKAGLNQLLAGVGYAVIPLFGLENKYVASTFDIFTGQYFYGASEEEVPNTNILGRSILRKNQQLYSDPNANSQLTLNSGVTFAKETDGDSWSHDDAVLNGSMAA